MVLHHCFTTVLRANNLHHFDDNSVGGMNRRSKINLVGTPPPDATWHTFLDDTWHVFSSGFPQEYTWRGLLLSGLPQGDLIRITPIRISPRVHVARFSYPDSLKERHMTLTNITSGRPPHRIWTIDIYYPNMFYSDR